MRTAAQLNRVAEADHAHAVTVLLAEEHDSSRGACLLYGGVTTLLKRIVGTDGLVDKPLHLAQLFGRNLLEVREVETQTLRRHHRTLLLDVRAEHLAQRRIEQVRGRVVVGRSLTLDGIYNGRELRSRIFRQFGRYVYYKSVLLLRGDDIYLLGGTLDISRVTDLAARVAVEGRMVEYELICGLALRRDAAVTGYVYGRGERIVSYKLAALDGHDLLPVVHILRCGVA